MVYDPIDNVDNVRDCTHKGWALGGEAFKAEIEQRTKRQAGSKGVGRPRIPDVSADK